MALSDSSSDPVELLFGAPFSDSLPGPESEFGDTFTHLGRSMLDPDTEHTDRAGQAQE